MGAIANPIRVLIVDRDDLFRQAVRTLLESTKVTVTVDEARDGQEALAVICELQPDAILWRIDTLCLDDPETTLRISELYPHGKTTLLDINGQEHLVLEVLKCAPRAGYLLDDS